jgi:hypothetical protein
MNYIEIKLLITVLADVMTRRWYLKILHEVASETNYRIIQFIAISFTFKYQ